ncbi:MAG TPA: preprotein translocase subunit YajC [Natronosporangium sp.]
MFLAQESGSEGGGGLLFPLLMIGGLFLIFYFLMIRPQKRRRQMLEKLQSELSVGDEVMTTSGLYGTVAELDDKTVILETSEGVYSRYARGAIMEVVTSSSSEAGSGADADSTSDSVADRDSKD